MHKALLIALLLFVSSSAVAEWMAVGVREGNSLYIDASAIRKDGNMVKIWYLHDFTTAQPIPGHRPYLSLKGLDEYDCKKMMVRGLYVSVHSENMGRGEIIFRNADAGKWEPIPPESGGAIKWKLACERQ